ncbi:MAG: hypothetical protein KGJ12_09355 [Gammaproteobacteria bacterium]|nr:hypothetical protein [Gammaproteobacteria bacterium]
MHRLFPLLRKSRLHRLALFGWLTFIALAPLQFCLSAYAAPVRVPVQSMNQPCGFTGVLHGMRMSRACMQGNTGMHLQCHRNHIATGVSTPQPSLGGAIALPMPAWSHAILPATRVSFRWLADHPYTRSSSLSTFLRYSRLLI